MIIDAIRKRRSVRSFKKDEVTDEQIREIIMTGEMAPSAKGNHGIEYLVIRNRNTKNKIYEIMHQPFLKEVPVLIIPIVKTEITVAPIQDISVATENMFLQATSMGLGTVWKNIHEDQVEPVKKILNIPENYTVINIIPVGFPDHQPPPHKDEDFNGKKIHWEQI